jgi:hypothetical protein
MLGHLLTIWTIRLALACYVAYLAGRLVNAWPARWPGIGRLAWTAGCAFFVAHVVAAFQFEHHWSNRAAVAETARQTRDLLGVAFGEGIYFSYLFLLVWVADVGDWWLRGHATRGERPRWLGGLVHGYLGFIAFNGAIVFEGGLVRWASVAAGMALAGLAAVCMWRKRDSRAVFAGETMAAKGSQGGKGLKARPRACAEARESSS